MSEQPIRLEEYDPTWPTRFAEERLAVEAVIGEWIAGGVEHVGSTAIPGAAAKPVIDIMVGVEGLRESRPAIPRLSDLGYRYFPYRSDVMHWFCKPSPQSRTHHLHLVPFGGRLWKERVAFRDHLIGHPEVAAAYVELKRELAERHRLDREAYTEAKTEFVYGVLRRAAEGRRSASPAAEGEA